MAGCWGKESLDAKTASKLVKRSPITLTCYKCKFCGGWHVGTNVMKKTQRILYQKAKNEYGEKDQETDL